MSYLKGLGDSSDICENFVALHAASVTFASNGVKLRWEKSEMPFGLNAVQKFLGPSGATSRSAILVPKTCLRSTQNLMQKLLAPKTACM
jgi:hypothetical protein